MEGGPDVGWAWVVAFAALMINFIIAGVGRVSGILFVAFIDIFGVDRETATMPFSVRSSARNLFGPVVGILGQKYGPRNVILVGGVIGTISSAICFFTPDIVWIIILWGGLNGIGTALTGTLPQVVIGQYFIKHRTTAAGMGFSGGCVGSFLFPALMEFFLQRYGMEGTFFLMSAIFMHVIPAALILKKPPWLKNSSTRMKNNKSPKLSQSLNDLTNKEDYDDVKFSSKAENVSVNKCSSDTALPNNNAVSETNFGNGNDKGKSKYGTESCSEGYPNVALLQEKGDLVAKIFECKNPGGDEKASANQNMFRIMKDFENLDHFLCNLQKKSHLNKNMNEVRDHLLREEKRNYSSVRPQNYRSFDSRRKISKEVIPRVCSVPNISEMINEESRLFILNQLSNVEDINEDKIAVKFPGEKDQIMSVLTELHKLNKLLLRASEKTVERAQNDQNLTFQDKEVKESNEDHSNTFAEHIKTAFKLYVNPLFLLIGFSRAAHFITFVPVMTTVVDFAMDKGFPLEDGKYVIAAISVGDLIGRLCLGWITDRGFLSPPRYMAVVMVLQGINTATIPMMHTKAAVFSSIALFGLLQGSLFVRHPVLVSRYMRPHEESIAMGCVNLFSGLLGFGLPAYIGYFRDTLGSYSYIFYINGLVGAVIGLLWFLEPIFVRCVNARRRVHKIAV